MTDASGAEVGIGENPDLRTIHRDLVALGRRLELSIDAAPSAAAIAAISEQIVEVNARATAAGRVLLVKQTEEITRQARAVSDAVPAIERELENLERFERVVRSVAAVLDAADEAVRVATLLVR